MSSGTSVNRRTVWSITLVAEAGALGARDREALGEVAARQGGDVVAAEHARLAPVSTMSPADGVDQQLVPRRGDEVGIERRPTAAAHAAVSREPPAAGPSGSTSRTGVRSRTQPVGLRLGREPHDARHHRRRRAVPADPLDLLDAVLQRTHHGVLVAQPGQPGGGLLVLGVLDGEQHDVDGPVDRLRVGAHRAGHDDRDRRRRA